ncbi:MAG: hypothetical protein KAR42_17425 [candidate division Zixibacteria bacterium]|nr:hypothetical protein [candidate division Zixibacteria bacterium]
MIKKRAGSDPVLVTSVALLWFECDPSWLAVAPASIIIIGHVRITIHGV